MIASAFAVINLYILNYFIGSQILLRRYAYFNIGSFPK